jgi:predicted secreted acid phosphatase
MDVIFDIDGTLMDIQHRKKYVEQRPKDWTKFRQATGKDSPKKEIFDIAKSMQKAGHNIIIASGRNKSQRPITLMQLMGEGLVFRALYMRSDSDYRPDHVVKEGMLNKMKEHGWNPQLVFDDRTSVVDMWRSKGLTAVQVAPGDF